MKKVLTILVAALFLGACHCTKCTTAPNRSNTCASAASCHGKHHHKGCPKAAAKPAPAKPAPAPKPVAKVTDDKDLAEVATVSRKADSSAVLSFKEPIKFAHNSDEIDNDSYTMAEFGFPTRSSFVKAVTAEVYAHLPEQPGELQT